LTEDTLRTRIEVVGAEEAKASLIEYFQAYKAGTQDINALNTGLKEQAGSIYGARRSLMLMRTDWKMQHAAWVESASVMRGVGQIGREITSMWQAYSVAQIRVTQAEQGVSSAHANVAILQDELNSLTAQGKASSEEYYDTLIKLTEAQGALKLASDGVSKAQTENIVGYVGMGLQVSGLFANIVFMLPHLRLLTQLINAQTIATGLATVASYAHAAALWLVASAAAVAKAFLAPEILIPAVVAGGLAVAWIASQQAKKGMATGGIVPTTGWYYLHQQEHVQKAGSSAGGSNITFNIYGKDARETATTISGELSALRRRGVI
jgi:hypothetical protein